MDAGVLNYQTPPVPPRPPIGPRGVALILGMMVATPIGIGCVAVALDKAITLLQFFTPSDVGTALWLLLVGVLLLTPLAVFAFGLRPSWKDGVR